MARAYFPAEGAGNTQACTYPIPLTGLAFPSPIGELDILVEAGLLRALDVDLTISGVPAREYGKTYEDTVGGKPPVEKESEEEVPVEDDESGLEDAADMYSLDDVEEWSASEVKSYAQDMLKEKFSSKSKAIEALLKAGFILDPNSSDE